MSDRDHLHKQVLSTLVICVTPVYLVKKETMLSSDGEIDTLCNYVTLYALVQKLRLIGPTTFICQKIGKSGQRRDNGICIDKFSNR